MPLSLEVRFLPADAAADVPAPGEPAGTSADADGLAPVTVGPRSGRTENLGRGGAFIRCLGSSPAVGTAVQLSLDAPALHQPLELRGEVRWVSDEPHEPAGFGVRFIEADRRAAAALSALLTAQSLVGRIETAAGSPAEDAGSPPPAPAEEALG
jgi:uncharacterized protein (TIGR02266 family)